MTDPRAVQRYSIGIAFRANGTGLVLARWDSLPESLRADPQRPVLDPVVTFIAAVRCSSNPRESAEAAKVVRGDKLARTRIDPGPFGKSFGDELARRYGLGGEIVDPGKGYAELRRGTQELMAESMRLRLVAVVGCPLLVQEWRRALWKPGRVEDEPSELSVADASVWAWGGAAAYMNRPKPVPKRLTLAEVAAKMEAEMEKAALRRMEEGEREWWDDGP
jgi:hypothetical protein